jgi:hypothetical protein
MLRGGYRSPALLGAGASPRADVPSTSNARYAPGVTERDGGAAAERDAAAGQQAPGGRPRPDAGATEPDFDWAWDQTPDYAPPPVDVSRPSVARMYDYFLGGKDNYPVDRAAAASMIEAVPNVELIARANRAFLVRSVTCLAADHGIDQFLDLGAGIPTPPNVHETAREVNRDTRVVYVDNDPIVLTHHRAQLSSVPHVTAVSADVRDPAAVLQHPAVTGMLDLTRPVGLLCVAVVHFIEHDIAPAMMRAYQAALAPGSAVVISALCRDTIPDHLARQAEDIYARSSAAAVSRSRAQIDALFDGLTYVPPGLTDIALWRNSGPPIDVILGGIGLVTS